MTTIAYRDGIMAGDTLVTLYGTRDSMTEKVRKTKSGWLVGGCGSLGELTTAFRWAEKCLQKDGSIRDRAPESKRLDLILVAPDGTTYGLSSCGDGGSSGGWPAKVTGMFMAAGSGADLARGAMALNAPADLAVRVAMSFDTGSGGEVQVVKLDSTIAQEAIAEAAARATKENAERKAAAAAAVAQAAAEAAASMGLQDDKAKADVAEAAAIAGAAPEVVH